MRTAVLTELTEFELEDRPRPSPGPDDVLVAVRDVGICGSDVHYYEHGRIGDYVVENPLVLGHESAGEVVEVGENVMDHEPGDRVALEPGVPCRRCAHCKRGDYHLCESVRFMATPPHDGAFTEYVSWPADFAYELPESVSTAEGALCEPLSVGIHACRRGSVGTGDTVLITGAGPIGLMILEAARATGATDVIMTDVVDEKLAFAEERGADLTVNVTETDLHGAVAEYTDGIGADVVAEASGAEPSIKSTIDVVRRGGTVVLVGLASEAEVPIDVLELIDNEVDVHGSFRYKNTYDAAIDLLANGEVDVEGIIDFQSGLEDIDDAFRRVMEPTVVKGMISLDS
ncbi:NAD(P)-dependent alcohol dehydrogenase [Haloarcula sp. CBA1130]|uniref:NAD(P)-dependent alcohol dehydrogenase n=1 Tax=unclassified Haloarcula TaxID=2624677 RepID=UPI001247C42A|nr:MULTISPECIES: NAD(P)-dependent alcohol dehydrogenase [unclassified Haloarcula]KAA9396586.1 NAD(P)-dependent alcohol dehydrogenase [Haloarcula sp. CBA1130]KAA9397446.1 NAD(P)-dependent alcohol dehydrogenase [Haloarcula sp. CBA1129]